MRQYYHDFFDFIPGTFEFLLEINVFAEKARKGPAKELSHECKYFSQLLIKTLKS